MAITRRGALALPALMALPSLARAAEIVRIGCILPLTGNSAAQGLAMKHAIELAVRIINDPTPELKPALLAADAGLPRLGGAKVEVIYSDDQGSPSVAQSTALRLITQDHVTALVVSYA
ncbi:MAG: ABC transporter substrate-binding protein, partial [Acetobacteraceae bacterium]